MQACKFIQGHHIGILRRPHILKAPFRPSPEINRNRGYDANTAEKGDKEEEKELPGTVTLLATPEQSKILAELEADGKPHLALVYRGSKENAAKFVEAQEARLLELYPPEETEEPEEAGDTEEGETESRQMPEETQEAAGETEPGLPVTPPLEQEEG